MIERARADTVVEEWLAAWNAHDPERVVADFAPAVEVRSPIAAALRPDSGGVLRGTDAVLSYYRDGLAASPELHFTLVDTCIGVDEITIVYRNQRGVLVSETLTMPDGGQVTRVSVAYGP